MPRSVRVYPVFLPHWGCPFQCVYCNQHVVTSSGLKAEQKGEIISCLREKLERLVEDSVRMAVPGEISFYGGTFTALQADLMRELLGMASFWVEKGVFTGIRFSTRPDGITPEVCSILKNYPISTVELGVQSLSDAVLHEARRGYTLEKVLEAVALVRQQGWMLGLQLMLGLPGDTLERFQESISRTIDMQPDFVRLYPTLVLENTLLAKWYRQGLYRPLSLDEALSWCVPAYDALLQANIPIARMGLHADPELERAGNVLAGPYHPAFGYLVRVHWWRDKVDSHLRTRSDVRCCGQITLLVSSRIISEVVGPARVNISYWQEKWRLERIDVKGEPGRHPMRIEFVCATVP